MTDLKTVLVDALNASASKGERPYISQTELTFPYEPQSWDDDDDGPDETRPMILIQTGEEWESPGPERGFYFDADRLAQTITDHFLDREKVRAALEEAFLDQDSPMLAECRAEWTVDRLIEGLTGGSSS